MAIVAKAKRQVTIGYVRDGKRRVELRSCPRAQGKYEMGDIGVSCR